MREIIAGLIAATFILAAPARAGDQPVVVELFTSQGCSSCPPADRLLSEIAKREDVIALALHVDYWDYLGWTDKFASAEFTRRQRAYAKARHERTVYTPQMIVQGVSPVIGHHKGDVDRLIAKHSEMAEQVELELARNGKSVEIRVRALAAGVGPAVIQLVRYLPNEAVAIGAGENAGTTIVYSNIVTSWNAVATWNGSDALVARAAAPGPEKLVVLVQRAGPGQIIAAGKLD